MRMRGPFWEVPGDSGESDPADQPANGSYGRNSQFRTFLHH